jgi:hypothetical protein
MNPVAAKFDQKNPLFIAGAAFLVVFLAISTSVAAMRWLPGSIGRGGVYAVFLANGQVYFGNIARENDRSLYLKNIYYLKLSKPVLSQEDLQDDSAASLVKLGNELHGPEDAMEVRQSQILFVEKLKGDSKVTKAIDQYKNGGQK